MAIWSRLKTLAGGAGTPPTLASAATLTLPEVDNGFYVSGTTTITSLVASTNTYNREVTFIGAASANVTFTNTDSPTTAGQMYLQGSNRLLQESDVLKLFCQTDGTWILVSTTTG